MSYSASYAKENQMKGLVFDGDEVLEWEDIDDVKPGRMK